MEELRYRNSVPPHPWQRPNSPPSRSLDSIYLERGKKEQRGEREDVTLLDDLPSHHPALHPALELGGQLGGAGCNTE